MLMLSLSEKPDLLEENDCGINFKKSPYPFMLSGCNNEQECSLFWSLIDCCFLGFCNHNKF
jgi:hypothetical protein